MSEEDRQRWNERYARGDHADLEPSAILVALDPWLPRHGRALDVAGGSGRHAHWLARRGLEVLLTDISEVAISRAAAYATAENLSVEVMARDLETEPVPFGPWDLIVDFHFLHRPLVPRLIESLAPNGVLVIVQPTVRNLERHARPSARFLLESGELATLLTGLHVLHYEEDWTVEGRHEAVGVARNTM